MTKIEETNPLEIDDIGILEELATGIYALVEVQSFVSAKAGVVGEPTNEQFREMFLALSIELGELAQEVGWKSWKDNPEVNDERTKLIEEEWADCLAFFGIITKMVAMRAKTTPSFLVKAYIEKSKKNIARFNGTSGEEGYNGIKGD